MAKKDTAPAADSAAPTAPNDASTTPNPAVAAAVAGIAAQTPPAAVRDAFEKAGDEAFAAAIKEGKSPEDAAKIAQAAAKAAREGAAAGEAAGKSELIEENEPAPQPGRRRLSDDEAPYPAMRGQPAAFQEAFERAETRMKLAADPVAFAAAIVRLGEELTELARNPDAVSKIETGYKEERIEVAGEGTFIVRRNGWDARTKQFLADRGKVELIAKAEIGGTGIQPGNLFAVEPAEAVRLVLAGGAAPRQQGGVRRAKGLLGALGEDETSAP